MIDMSNKDTQILLSQVKIFIDLEKVKGETISIEVIVKCIDKVFDMLAPYVDGVNKEDIISYMTNIILYRYI